MSRKDELLAEIEKIEAEEKKQKEDLAKKKAEEWGKIKSQYEWKVTVGEQKASYWQKDPLKGVLIARKIKSNLYEQFIKEWGGANLNLWDSMFYYRTDENILTYSGSGGVLILNTPKLCSDEEWEQIVSGNIPEKFKRID
jgi:hypothetical protein